MSLFFANAAAASARISEFAFNSFILLSKDKDISYSPFCTAKALEILRYGLKGESFNAIDKILKDESLTVPKLLTAQVNVANSYWADNSILLKKDFRSDIANKLGAKVETVEFNKKPAKAAALINQWASDSTHGLINHIVEASEISNLVSILASALYVKGRWFENGHKLSSEYLTFHKVIGPKKIEFLQHTVDNRLYYKGDQVQIVEMPLSNGELHLGIILPNANIQFENWKKSLSAKQISNWLSQLKSEYTYVQTPQMDIKNDFNLNRILIANELGPLFRLNKDFSPITDQAFMLTDVKQKTVFKVDKIGIEAAAITYVMTAGAMFMEHPKPIEIMADRPHLFYLATQKNEHILFFGQFMGNADK